MSVIGLLLLSAAAGVLSGMAAGGGVVLVPGLVLLFAIPQHAAQGAVLAAFLATQSAAALGQWRQRTIQPKMAAWMIAGTVAGALLGAWMAIRTRPASLRQLYGWYLIGIGVVNWLNTKVEPAPVQNRR